MSWINLAPAQDYRLCLRLSMIIQEKEGGYISINISQLLLTNVNKKPQSILFIYTSWRGYYLHSLSARALYSDFFHSCDFPKMLRFLILDLMLYILRALALLLFFFKLKQLQVCETLEFKFLHLDLERGESGGPCGRAP